MMNFFAFPLKSPHSRYKFSLNPIFLFLLMITALSLSGCICRRYKCSKATNLSSKINIEERLKNAEAVKASLLKQLENPKTVDETISIKQELNKIQDEIDQMQSWKKVNSIKKDDDGFRSVKKREITYGPIGLVVEITKNTLEKLWIWDER